MILIWLIIASLISKNLKITNYAANVKFVADAIVDNNTILETQIDTEIRESEIRSIKAIQQENIFKKVMTDNLFKENDDAVQLITIFYISSIIKHIFLGLKKMMIMIIMMPDCQLIYVIYLLVLTQWPLK